MEFDYEGAVPAWLDWFYTEIPSSTQAKKVVWDRLNLIGEQPIIVPILMCPDDLDFFCFVLVAEIRYDENTVRWGRIGLDTSENRGDAPETLGEAVEWFDFIPPFVFRKDEFSECVETFRLALKQDFTEQTEI